MIPVVFRLLSVKRIPVWVLPSMLCILLLGNDDVLKTVGIVQL